MVKYREILRNQENVRDYLKREEEKNENDFERGRLRYET